MQKIFEKIGCHSNDVSPRPLQWISQNEEFSHSSLKILVLRLIFSVPDPLL